jgi:hypothetical protein
MRAILFCLVGLMTAASEPGFAQMKLSPKAALTTNETVTSAVLDVCYPAQKGSDRKDRFVANLAVNGQTLTGATQSIGDKLPVTVKLVRRPTGDTFEFRGQIGVGQTVTEVTSSDNSDLSEKEFLDNQTRDDGINATPKDFSEVSPESIGVRVKLEAALDFLRGLKGQEVEVAVSGLALTCDALRAGEQTVNITADPDRAAALISKFKSLPGVVAAGWTSGVVDMERSIRFSAADWREGDRINKDKLATAIANVLSKTLSAKSASSTWNASTGKLKMTFKRPSPILPALDLTETIEITALVAPDKPGSSDRLMLWIGNPAITTADETAGPRLNLADEGNGDEEGDQKNDNGAVDALAREFKGQRWDVDKSAWK